MAFAGASLMNLARFARVAIEERRDHSLADAVLARWPNRLETATLFLYATPAQRASMMLAAQRAELARTHPADRADFVNPWLEDLEAHALAGRADAFSESLAKALGCDSALAERIAADRSGEALVAALGAIGAPGDVSVRILTSSDLRDGADYRRVGALARLQDSLSPAAARRIVAAMIGADEATPASAPVWRGSDRRPRPAPAFREDAASVRRRRAFAMLAESQKL